MDKYNVEKVENGKTFVTKSAIVCAWSLLFSKLCGIFPPFFRSLKSK